MNTDTHGAAGKPWIGFDLDGTLAEYDGWKGIENIGNPVKPMVDLVKQMHGEGKVVKILTARVSPRLTGDTHAQGCNCGHCEADAAKPPVMQEQYVSLLDATGKSVRKYASDYIREWCEKNLGFSPEIVHTKDHLMIALYDDRVKQVVQNVGITVEDLARSLAVTYPSYISLLKAQAQSIKKNHPHETGTQRAERDQLLDHYDKAIADVERRYSVWIACEEMMKGVR